VSFDNSNRTTIEIDRNCALTAAVPIGYGQNTNWSKDANHACTEIGFECSGAHNHRYFFK